MSRQLVESILSGNMLEANDMVEAKMAEIRERKMYEMKRMYAAESSFSGGQNPEDVKKKPGYRGRASEVLGQSPYYTRKERQAKPKSSGKAKETASEPDKFGDTKPTPLKKDPRLRTMDRLKKNLDRYETLKAKGSKTADARMLKIAKGYAGKTAKQAVKNVAKGTAAAVGRAIDSPVVQDLKSIGFRNL